jgi:hypothetical protein
MLHQALSEKANWACSLRPGGLRSRRPNWLFQIGFGNILIRPISAENNQFEPLSIDPQQNLVSSDIDRNNLQYRPQQNPVAIQYPHDKSINTNCYYVNTHRMTFGVDSIFDNIVVILDLGLIKHCTRTV